MRATPPLLALILLAAWQQPGLAQVNVGSAVKGVVIDRSTGDPVAAVELRIMETGMTAVADVAGRWAFPAVAPGKYNLRARRIGYTPETFRLELGAADSTLTLSLVPAALPLNELVVTAARREQRLADVAVPTEVVTREALEATGAADLSDALTEQTGVQFDGGHPSGAGVMLQGLSNERVLVLMDGQPLYGRVAGTLDLSRVPTAIVDRVEIVKGPQAALYGSEAMGGVVNIITRTPANLSWNGGARATVGSAGRRDGGITGELRQGGFAALVDFGRRDIDRASGQVAEAGALAERVDGNARLIWQPESSLTLETAVLVLDERQRWPSGTQFQFADNTHVSARLGADWKTGRHRLRPALYVSRFDHLSRASSVPQPIAGTGDQQVQRLIEGEVVYGGTALGRGALDGGVEVRQEHISSDDGRIAGGARTLYSVEPFAQLDWSTDRWSIVPGVRVTWNEGWGSAVTPRLAMRYRLSDALTLRAAGGRGFRAPDFKELYLQFINDAAGYSVYGNSDLRPEHSTNLTTNVEWTGARVYGRAQLFWNDLHDFIETRPLPDDGSGLLRFSYANVSRGRTWGAELEGGWALSAVQLEAGYAYLGTEDGATGQPLLGRPVHSGRVGAIAGFLGLRTTLSAIYTGETPMERDETGLVTSERDAFLRLDARLAHRLPWGLEVALGADNVFNSQPEQWADAVGRQWYAGLTWTATPTPR